MQRLPATTRALLAAGWICLALGPLLGPLPASAQEAHEHHVGAARAPAPGRLELGTGAATDSRGRLWVAQKQGEHVVVRHSADEGASWSPPVRVNAAPEPIAAAGEAWPKIALGPAGEVYVSWTKPLPRPYTGEIRFARSVDGGASFSSPITVHQDRQEITHRFDALAVGPDGRVFVAWIDKRDQEAAKAAKRAYRGAAIYLAISSDQGAHFGGDIRLADHSCECCRLGLAPHTDGRISVIWRHVFPPNIRDHAIATLSADGQPGPLLRASHDNWRIDACPHHGPSLARDAHGRYHAVWFTQGPGKEGVHYARLAQPEGGAELRTEVTRRIGGAAAEHADLALSGEQVAVVWKEFDGQRTRLKALRSEDAGGTWRAEAEIASTTAPSDNPRLLVQDGRFRVLWPSKEAPLRLLPLP